MPKGFFLFRNSLDIVDQPANRHGTTTHCCLQFMLGVH